MRQMALILVGLLISFAAQAKITVSAKVSDATSIDVEATELTKTLTSLGVKGYTSNGLQEISLTGQVTIFNGAACDNGNKTYAVTLKEVDGQRKPIQTINFDNGTVCDGVSTAQSLAELLDRWGGSTLQGGDCGGGRCLQTITSIACTHFVATPENPAFDSCDVVLTN